MFGSSRRMSPTPSHCPVEQVLDRLELRALGARGCGQDERRVLQITAVDDIAERGPDGVLPDEPVGFRRQQGTVLAERHGQFAAGAQGRVPVHRQVREDLRPELRQVVVHDRRLHQPGIDHLQQVVVLEAFGRVDDDDGRPPVPLEPRIEREQAVVIAARPPDEDLAAAEVLGRGDRRNPRRGHDDLADVAPHGPGKVDERLSFGRHGELRGDDVDASVQ